MTSPADLGWGDPRALTNADMTGAQLWPGHVVRVRNDDCAVVMTALVRRLRAAGWTGPDPLLDEWGYTRRLKRWAEAKYRAQGLTEAQWLQVAPLSEWSDHAWGTAVDLDTAANPMLPTRPANPQAHTTLPVAACPGIAAALGLEWGGSWTEPWDLQHFQVAVTPQRLAQIAAPLRRSMEVLDYSSGYPSPAAIRAANYAGVVRYVGTPGRGKNLTRAEAQAMAAAGIPIALVYEDAAGWMRGGKAAGAAAAAAALRDAANCGVEVRCVYLACDEDVTTQMPAVLACLDGAATVLGLSRTGVYGEADVIDAAVPGRASRGWQTKAWSGGRVSNKAGLLQLLGYRTVGGVQCDANTVLKDDWGQWPYQGDDDMPLTQADANLIIQTLNIGAQASHGAQLDDFFVRAAEVAKTRGHATTAQVQAVVTALANNAAAVSAGITDTRSAVLGALAALPTGGLTDTQCATLAADIAASVAGLGQDEVESALRHVFADAGTPPTKPAA
jgi:hypothetical protein